MVVILYSLSPNQPSGPFFILTSRLTFQGGKGLAIWPKAPGVFVE